MNASDVWVFGYGSLIWDRHGLSIVEERIGEIQGWHRDWTWISKKRRHGAPTCSLQPGGKVKGVFLKIDPKTCQADLETLRKRELRSSEKVIESLSGFPGKVHFWTMGNNLNKHYNAEGLKGRELYRFLAEIAKNIPNRGPNGRTAEEYALAIHEFDPEDEITKTYVDELKKLPKKESSEDQNRAIQAVKTRIGSLKANRNFLTALFTVGSIVLTLLVSYSKSSFLWIPAIWSLTSLGAAILSIFALTDSIHFYSKYLEYRFAWVEDVHIEACKSGTSEDNAKAELKRALEADDVGYYWAKFSFLFFLWFIVSFVFVLELDLVWKMSAFLPSVVLVTSLAVMTYKITHRKGFLKAIKDFFIRKSVFNDKSP